MTVHKGACHREAEKILNETGQAPLWIPLSKMLIYLDKELRRVNES